MPPLHARPADELRHLAWPVRLTRAGIIAEQAVRAFWPLWTIFALALAPILMGWHEAASVEVLWGGGVVAGIAMLAALWWGLRRFSLPTRAQAVARVDASLPGRPIAAVADTQAVGASDPASQAVWRAHLERMEARTRAARAVQPDLRVSDRDPYGTRFIALLFLVTALLFGTLWRVTIVAEPETGANGLAIITGPVWEGWIEPPDYTGKPSLYLADVPAGRLDVSEGSRVTLRLYGDVGALTVDETVSGRTDDLGAASDSEQAFDITRAGRLAIVGAGDDDGRTEWHINVIADAPPTVEVTGEAESDARGEFTLPFKAADDFAVAAGQATVRLDLDAIRRTHGLTVDPDPREPLIVDLPMPFSGDRATVEDVLVDDFSQHPFANLPVTITLLVEDALGQFGETDPTALTLPARRFFQPVARAVIEQRRDLMWSMDNGARVLGILRAVGHRPEDIFTSETSYLRLNVTLRTLAASVNSETGLTPEVRDEVAEALWDLAIQLEEGSLADARERLERAQERLAEAMRSGATDEEIAELMQELREATDDYMQMLADTTEFGDTTDQPDSGDQGDTISQSEIDALMDRIQELMEEGRMAEAAELMDQLNEMMENMQIVQGEPGQGGPRTPGQQSMEDLQDQLRDQQELSDDAFRELQEQFNGQNQPGQDPGQNPGQQPGQQPNGQGTEPGQNLGPGAQDGSDQRPQGQAGVGQSPGDAPGGPGQQNDLGPGGEGGDQFPPGAQGTLAERQEDLRRELERLQDSLPALSGEAAEAAREAIANAERAMDEAEEALRQNDLAEAIDRQAEALDALRDGMRSLGRALAENEQDPNDDPARADGGQAQGRLEPERRDPLGRQLGNTGQYGTDENMLQGSDVYRRAEELLDEIRRRAAELDRGVEERDYLRRVLERF